MRFRSTDALVRERSAAGRSDDAVRRFTRRLIGGPRRWPCVSVMSHYNRCSTQAGEADIDQLLRRVEAVLFLAREPLSSRKLSWYANLADGTAARTLIRLLNEDYDRSGRSFRVEEVGGGFQLLTRARFAPWLRRLEHSPPETRLSTPAIETLAVVAYRQPVLRAEIEAIRGVGCGEVLRQLMERDMVRIAGRSDELGRPYLYGTTKRFLQAFGLRNADELPRAAALGREDVNSGTNQQNQVNSTDGNEEEFEVSATAPVELVSEEEKRLQQPLPAVISESDDWEYEDESEDFGEEDDDFDDEEFEDDEEEYDEDEDDDADDDDADDDDADDDFEDEEWEEVDDDEEEEDAGDDEDDEDDSDWEYDDEEEDYDEEDGDEEDGDEEDGDEEDW